MDEEEDEDVKGTSAGQGDSENELEEESKPISQAPKRPKKRPRLDDDDDDVEMENEDETAEEGVFEETSTPEALGALPSFPLPAHPNAPSKSLLALQGLDDALLGAELISPITTLPIPSGQDDGGTRLSERMRKRLKDIGITELFAGGFLAPQRRALIDSVYFTVQTALLPFLLPLDISNQLYLPYKPPRDVCVSAPTGSGKTLAYVLPIIEVRRLEDVLYLLFQQFLF